MEPPEALPLLPLGNFFQCLTPLQINRFCIIISYKSLDFSLCPLSLVLSPESAEKGLQPWDDRRSGGAWGKRGATAKHREA